jgi:hypothetical protein
MNLGDRQFLIGFNLNVLRNPPCHKVEELNGGAGKLMLYLHNLILIFLRHYYTVNRSALPLFPDAYG